MLFITIKKVYNHILDNNLCSETLYATHVIKLWEIVIAKSR
jgi:hypothetical protein